MKTISTIHFASDVRAYEMLDHFHGTLHRLDFRKQFILFSVTLLEEVVDAKLVFQSRTVVEDVLDSFALD